MACAVLLALHQAGTCAEGAVLDTMDQPTFAPGDGNAAVEVVDGRVGKALAFSFHDGCRNSFISGPVRGGPDWDRAAGISFWVKGDGSSHCGGVQLVWNEDYTQRYDAAFPIDGTAWTKVVLAWSDLIPALSNPASAPLDAHGDHPPSRLGRLWFGKWWYWGDYAAHRYAIDDIRLEPVIPVPEAPRPAAGAALARVRAKLAAHQPITVVAMGDSLTDVRHWSNRERNWPAFFQAMAKDAWGSEVTVVNTAMGGTELRQNLVVVPRWVATTPHPDLVVVEFGGNDWNGGMRQAAFAAAQADAIRRIRRATGGTADVLVVATLPSVATWDAIGELAEACRGAAKQEEAGLCDAFALFHRLGAQDRERLYANDHVHLGEPGQRALAQAVLEAIAPPAR
jgi:lysophospholipase L1-like esterase